LHAKAHIAPSWGSSSRSSSAATCLYLGILACRFSTIHRVERVRAALIAVTSEEMGPCRTSPYLVYTILALRQIFAPSSSATAGTMALQYATNTTSSTTTLTYWPDGRGEP